MMSCIVCFFCKQKTAYEMRISDWSSDVCSSDLSEQANELQGSGVIFRAIGPGLPRIENLAVDARHADRNFETEILIHPEFRIVQATSSAALSSARVTLMGIRLPTPYLPPVQPVLTSQHVTPPLAIRSFSRLPSIDGWRGMNGPPTQAEKVASGSVTPISVPATLAVSPERKRSDSQRLGKEGDRT